MKNAMSPADYFEDDGASFRVRQQRRVAAAQKVPGNTITREVGGPRWKKWLFWLLVAPPLAVASMAIGAMALMLAAG